MKETRELPPAAAAADLRFPPDRDFGLGVACGVRSLFSCGEKSLSGAVGVREQDFSFFSSSLFSEFVPPSAGTAAVVSEETEGDVSSSSVRFLFFSLPALGEKKERMSCCFSFSN